MENDKPNGIDLLNNGNIPSKEKQNDKAARFDSNRGINGNLSENDSEGDADENDISKVKQKNKDLKYNVGIMQKQLDNLTKEVQRMNDLIVSLQNEKKELLVLLQKKSPKKSPKRKRSRNNNTSEQKTTQETIPQKPIGTSIHANSDANVTEKDGNKIQTSLEQPQNSHTSAQAQHINNIVMSEDATIADKRSNALSVSHTEDSSSSSEDEDDDNDNYSDNEKDKHAVHTSTIKRSLKPPPIDVWTDNRADIQREIQTIVPNNSCLYSRINNMKFRVLPNDDTARSVVIDYLNKKKYNYNTYTPSNSKMINVLIKGLDHIDDSDTIKSELAEKGFEPYQIKKYVTGHMRKNNNKSNLWLIVLQPNTDTKELFKIKAIDHAIVKFEFLRKPKVIQCRRCQRFNHSASNCSLPYRCVKCTNTHEPGQCPSTTMKNKFKPKCVNCNGNHTANDAANCEVFKKVIESKEKKQKPVNKKSISVNKQSSLRSNQTYADRVKSNSVIKPALNKNTGIDKFIENQNKMMSDFMATMQKMQQQFISSFVNKNGQ